MDTRLIRIALVAATAVGILTAAPANAQDESSLTQDYEALAAACATLEAHIDDLEVQQKAAVHRQEAVEGRLKTCSEGQWQIFWEKNLSHAEQRRRELERLRREVERLRARTESERRRWETIRRAMETRYRGRSRGADYDEDFRHYMIEFERSYVTPFKNAVFPAYEAYFAGATGYATFIEESVRCCEQGNFSDAAVKAADAAIEEVSNAVKHMMGFVQHRTRS